MEQLVRFPDRPPNQSFALQRSCQHLLWNSSQMEIGANQMFSWKLISRQATNSVISAPSASTLLGTARWECPTPDGTAT
jgi:hypothetical protein